MPDGELGSFQGFRFTEIPRFCNTWFHVIDGDSICIMCGKDTNAED